MAHILDISDLQGLGVGTELASSVGHGVQKRLFIKNIILPNNKISSSFAVENFRKEIIVTDNLEIAVKVYNSIT